MWYCGLCTDCCEVCDGEVCYGEVCGRCAVVCRLALTSRTMNGLTPAGMSILPVIFCGDSSYLEFSAADNIYEVG